MKPFNSLSDAERKILGELMPFLGAALVGAAILIAFVFCYFQQSLSANERRCGCAD